jgi:predicted transcriptional regulator
LPQNPGVKRGFLFFAVRRYDMNAAMTRLLEQAIAKLRQLPEDDQDAIAIAVLSMADADASRFPLDPATLAAIREGLSQADRGEFVPDEVVAESNKRHGI